MTRSPRSPCDEGCCAPHRLGIDPTGVIGNEEVTRHTYREAGVGWGTLSEGDIAAAVFIGSVSIIFSETRKEASVHKQEPQRQKRIASSSARTVHLVRERLCLGHWVLDMTVLFTQDFPLPHKTL